MKKIITPEAYAEAHAKLMAHIRSVKEARQLGAIKRMGLAKQVIYLSQESDADLADAFYNRANHKGHAASCGRTATGYIDLQAKAAKRLLEERGFDTSDEQAMRALVGEERQARRDQEPWAYRY